MPIPCRTCQGAKSFAFRTCGHFGSCPCGEFIEIDCERCGGLGVETCSECSRPLEEGDVGGTCSVCDAEYLAGHAEYIQSRQDDDDDRRAYESWSQCC